MDPTRLEAEAEANVSKAKELSEAMKEIIEILRPFYNLAVHCGFSNNEIKRLIAGCLDKIIYHGRLREITFALETLNLIWLFDIWFNKNKPEQKLQIQNYTELIGNSNQTITDLHFSLRPPAILQQP